MRCILTPDLLWFLKIYQVRTGIRYTFAYTLVLGSLVPTVSRGYLIDQTELLIAYARKAYQETCQSKGKNARRQCQMVKGECSTRKTYQVPVLKE